MAKNVQLTYEDRCSIEDFLKEGKSFRKIGESLGKDPSSISKEVRAHYITKESPAFNPCRHAGTCCHRADLCDTCTETWGRLCKRCQKACFERCPDYEEMHCSSLDRPPYVCNGCKDRQKCHLKRHLYNARCAQEEYETIRTESRRGFAVTEDEIQRLDSIISPLIRKGQSIHHICVTKADEIMLDEKTIYNYIDAGLFTAGNLDLPRKVRYRPRKKKKPYKVDKRCHVGRTYEDYLTFIKDNPDLGIVEMDTVEGKRGGKVLLTLFFTGTSVLLAFLRDHNTAKSVKDIFDALYKALGRETFIRLFPVILTDRGSEFTDPLSIEFDEEGNRRTHVFYCDPQRSDQKGSIEVAHEFIRRILPKGTSFDNLSQDQIDLLVSHINSYTRKKLGNRSPLRLFSFLFGQDVVEKLHLSLIPSDQINLTTKLLNK